MYGYQRQMRSHNTDVKRLLGMHIAALETIARVSRVQSTKNMEIAVPESHAVVVCLSSAPSLMLA